MTNSLKGKYRTSDCSVCMYSCLCQDGKGRDGVLFTIFLDLEDMVKACMCRVWLKRSLGSDADQQFCAQPIIHTPVRYA